MFADAPLASVEDNSKKTRELQDLIRDYIMGANKTTLTPKQIAELICENDLEARSSENRLESINLVKHLLKAEVVTESHKHKLESLLGFLESRAFNATKKISRALF